MGPLRELGSAAVVGALIVGALTVVAALLRAERWRSRRERIVRVAMWFIAGFGAGLTIAVTLLPYGAPAPERYVSLDLAGDLAAIAQSFPSWGETAQLVINLLLLSWLAFAIPLLAPRWRVRETAVLSLVVAVLIEVAQWLLPTGRVASLTDVLVNSLGAALVAGVTVHWVRPRLEAWMQPSADVPTPVEGRASPGGAR